MDVWDGKGPTVILEDNQPAINLTTAPQITRKSRHIALKEHYIRWLYQSKQISPKFIGTNDMLADSPKAYPLQNFSGSEINYSVPRTHLQPFHKFLPIHCVQYVINFFQYTMYNTSQRHSFLPFPLYTYIARSYAFAPYIAYRRMSVYHCLSPPPTDLPFQAVTTVCNPTLSCTFRSLIS